MTPLDRLQAKREELENQVLLVKIIFPTQDMTAAEEEIRHINNEIGALIGAPAVSR